MSHVITIDPRRGLVFLTRTSLDSFGDWRAALDDLLVHPDYRPGLHILDDRRALDRPLPRADSQQAFAYYDTRRAALGVFRWAIVVSPDRPVMYGAARVAQAFLEDTGIAVQVFTKYDAAVTWLLEGRAGPS